jgi:tRNA G18 (ribose-2'-O)-methylase SpoU
LGPTVSVIEQKLERESDGTNHLPIPGVNLHVLLDNIRSAWNVGSIFRAADGFGFRHAYLCGITPTPASSDVQKTALGAEELVEWSYHRNGVELVRDLRQQNYSILALEQTKDSISIELALSALQAKPVMVLVVGNEVAGIDPGILEISDCTCDIPMRGQKRSLNVAVAFAVAAQILISQY